MVRPSEVNCTSSRVDAPEMMLRDAAAGRLDHLQAGAPAILHSEEQAAWNPATR